MNDSAMTLEDRRRIAEALTGCISEQTARLLAGSDGAPCEEALIVTKHLIASQLEILGVLLARGASEARPADFAPDQTLKRIEALRGAAQLLSEPSRLPAAERPDAGGDAPPRTPALSLSHSVRR